MRTAGQKPRSCATESAPRPAGALLSLAAKSLGATNSEVGVLSIIALDLVNKSRAMMDSNKNLQGERAHDINRLTKDNSELILEMNRLRHEKTSAERKIADLENSLFIMSEHAGRVFVCYTRALMIGAIRFF